MLSKQWLVYNDIFISNKFTLWLNLIVFVYLKYFKFIAVDYFVHATSFLVMHCRYLQGNWQKYLFFFKIKITIKKYYFKYFLILKYVQINY